jgi:pilus assembly protein Flp/PilA
MLVRTWAWLVRFLQSEDGPTAIEYSVMLAVIILVCFVAITQIGASTDKNFNQLNTSLSGS